MRFTLAGTTFLALCPVLVSCTTLPSAAIGDPQRHGFVLIEGEAMVHLPKSGTRVSDIDAVTLENTAKPAQSLQGEYKFGNIWFSTLEPGTYRVRDVHVKGDPNEFTYHLPKDADPSALTFSVNAGGLVYLGYVEIFSQATSGAARIALVHNHHEFAAWEGVYDFYARTPWEPLILKRMAETK